MLAEPVALHDVRDVESFVHATINRSRIRVTPDERDELVCEGMVIMAHLANTFEQHRVGYKQPGRFSGYAAMYLPRKLGDSWHRLNASHRLITQPDGGRHWDYGEKPVSLEALTASNPDRHDLLSARPDKTDLRGRVGQALDERWQRRRKTILDVADILGEGGTPADAAQMLGLTSQQVHETVSEIMLVADRLRSMDE